MKPIGEVAATAAQSQQRLTLTSRLSSEQLAMSAKYAKLLLGCYRAGDANDPEVYTAAIIAILSDYPDEVQRTVTDPRAGLPARVQWLPTPKEVKDACDAEAMRQDRLRKYASLGPYQRVPRPPARKDYATVLVRKDLSMYAAMVERAKTADRAEFKFDEHGIWVAESWLPGAKFRS